MPYLSITLPTARVQRYLDRGGARREYRQVYEPGRGDHV
jgi:hypothetical protein